LSVTVLGRHHRLRLSRPHNQAHTASGRVAQSVPGPQSGDGDAVSIGNRLHILLSTHQMALGRRIDQFVDSWCDELFHLGLVLNLLLRREDSGSRQQAGLRVESVSSA